MTDGGLWVFSILFCKFDLLSMLYLWTWFKNFAFNLVYSVDCMVGMPLIILVLLRPCFCLKLVCGRPYFIPINEFLELASFEPVPTRRVCKPFSLVFGIKDNFSLGIIFLLGVFKDVRGLYLFEWASTCVIFISFLFFNSSSILYI